MTNGTIDETKKLEEMTIVSLRSMVVELGMPEEDAESFTVKKPLISSIKILRSRGKVVADFADSENKVERKREDDRHRDKAERMAEKLAGQPKIRIKVPLDIGGKEEVGVMEKVVVNGREEWRAVKGGYIPVTLNGYTIHVPKGRYWTVPEQVADVIGEADRAETEGGKDILASRMDPKTGKPVSDQL